MKNLIKISIFTLLLTPSLIAGAIQTPNNDIFIDDGIEIKLAKPGKPVSAKEWHARLYLKDEAAEGRESWGIISGKANASVLRDLKQYNEILDAFIAWNGKDLDKKGKVFSNSIAPIAVTIVPGTMVNKVNKRIKPLNSQISTLRSEMNRIVKIINNEPAQKKPFETIGKEFQIYSESVVKAIKALSELNQLAWTEGTTDKDVSPLIDTLESSVKRAFEYQAAMGRALEIGIARGRYGKWVYSEFNYQKIIKGTEESGDVTSKIKGNQFINFEGEKLKIAISLQTEDQIVNEKIISFDTLKYTILYKNLIPDMITMFRDTLDNRKVTQDIYGLIIKASEEKKGKQPAIVVNGSHIYSKEGPNVEADKRGPFHTNIKDRQESLLILYFIGEKDAKEAAETLKKMIKG